MKLLLISGDRSILEGKQGAFWYMLQEMRKYWERIDIICPKPDAAQIQLFDGAHHHSTKDTTGGEVFFHPCPKGLWYQATWILTKGQMLYAEYQHNVMTVHDYPPFYNGIGASRLGRRIGIPHVLEFHHIVGWPVAASFTEFIGRILTRLYIPFASRKAAAIRAVSSSVLNQLRDWNVPEQKLHLVPSFYLDKNLLTADIRPPIAYDVSFSGRLTENKGLMAVIDAISMLPQARLLVIGDGPLRAYAEERARELKMTNRVKFLGWMPTLESVIGAVTTARIFVMNSTSEGGPRNALEAMAAGMPVIVTRVGVMPDVIEDGKNGFFTTGEAVDLAAKIKFLLDDDKRREEMGKEASKILLRFERSALIKNYADFLQSFA